MLTLQTFLPSLKFILLICPLSMCGRGGDTLISVVVYRTVARLKPSLLLWLRFGDCGRESFLPGPRFTQSCLLIFNMPNGRACLQPAAIPTPTRAFHHPAPRGGGGAREREREMLLYWREFRENSQRRELIMWKHITLRSGRASFPGAEDRGIRVDQKKCMSQTEVSH